MCDDSLRCSKCVSPLSLATPCVSPPKSFVRNIAEQLIEKGLASVVRHKRDDEDRSPDYDKLMAAEQA